MSRIVKLLALSLALAFVAVPGAANAQKKQIVVA